MDETPPAKPRRRPRQARSQAIVESIVEACERILTSEGPTGLNTNRIAEVAGVNIASLYRYFPNKEAIVAELYERELAAYATMLDGLYERADEIDALPIEDTVRMLVDALGDLHRTLLALDSDFYRRHHERFDLASRYYPRSRTSWREQLMTWFGDVLARHDPSRARADVDRASFLVAAMVIAAFESAVREAPTRVEEPAFRDDVVAAILGLLRVVRT